MFLLQIEGAEAQRYSDLLRSHGEIRGKARIQTHIFQLILSENIFEQLQGASIVLDTEAKAVNKTNFC